MLSDFFFAATLVGVAIQVLGLGCLLVFYFQKPRPLWIPEGQRLPSVTILKSCHSAADNEAVNFDTFFRQDYPGKLQLLFVVSTENAPIVPIVRDYLARYPAADAQLVISKTRKAHWKKIDALYDGHQVSRHDIIIWSDSDAIVRPDYVSQMVSSLLEPGVSVVTVPQIDTGVNSFGSAFKVLGNSADLATYVMIAWAFSKRLKFGWGHSMAFRKAELDSFGPGAWDIINRFLADDQALPYVFVQHGKQVVFRNIDCPVQYSNKTLQETISQKRRWVWTQRIAVGNRWLYLLALLVYPQLTATAAVFLSGFEGWAMQLWGAVAVFRILVSLIHESLFLGSLQTTLRYFWTIALWDISQAFFILDGFLRNTIEFDGNEFRVVQRYFVERI